MRVAIIAILALVIIFLSFFYLNIQVNQELSIEGGIISILSRNWLNLHSYYYYYYYYS